MIDCHNHTLPGIDDGAKDLGMALDMANLATAAGIHTIIVTPHHLNGSFSNRRKDILRRVMKLRTAFAEQGIELRVYPGAELHLVPELPQQLAQGDALTLADRGKAALVELPKRSIPRGTEQILERILQQGITPVIAHPERNSELLAHGARVRAWVQMGCRLQLTAQSCAGAFGKAIQQTCREWCEAGLVHLLASDAHRPRGRVPDLRDGVAATTRWIGPDAVEVLTRTNPERLLNGQPLLDTSALVETHGMRPRWLRLITGTRAG